MSSNKLFGTDGVRGLANARLSAELAQGLGLAGAYVLTKNYHTMNTSDTPGLRHTPRILIGADTRRSSPMLVAALTSGMCAMGADVYDAGIIPTPGIAYAVRTQGYDAGVMVSASHNPFEDNGIKFFSADGRKLDDALEEEIEAIVRNGSGHLQRPTHHCIGCAFSDEGAALRAYTDYLVGIAQRDFGGDLHGLRVVIDCANGATCGVAKVVMLRLGASLIVLNDTPSGTNINEDCGSTHMDGLVSAVREHPSDIGIAFDGDGDRALFVDENGKTVDGDQVLSICAAHLQANGRLKNNTLVATVMSNLGLQHMCEANGIHLEKTAVGDRYVMEALLAGGHTFGGEQSGHIIFLEDSTTGDGLLTAIKLLSILVKEKKSLSAANSHMQVLPQVLINVPVAEAKKNSHLDHEQIRSKITCIEEALAGTGRLLVRPSGTESTLRIMLEGPDEAVLRAHAEGLAALVREHLA